MSPRTVLAVAAAVALIAAIVILSGDEDDLELSSVESAPPRLLDDGAGQRHFEVSYPKGDPRGTILFIHGGGWRSHGPVTFESTLFTVNDLTDAGFRVVAVSFDESPQLSNPEAPVDSGRVTDDVLAFYDQTRDAFGDGPICSFGISGGGHLALMLATQRELDCAAAIGPPTDLVKLTQDGRLGSDPRARCEQEPKNIDQEIIGVQLGACYAIATWGARAEQLREASPALQWRDSLGTEVWAAFELADPVIPPSQREALERGISGATIETARPDPEGPVLAHAGVRSEDRNRVNRSLIDWLTRTVAPGSPGEQSDGASDGAYVACNAGLESGPDWESARRRDRADLLDSAGLWKPSRGSENLMAVNGCDGREQLQSAGLQIATPGFSRSAPALIDTGATASWNFEAPSGEELTEHSASYRGFLANPGVWDLGLYARGEGDDWAPVAICHGGECDGLDTSGSRGIRVAPRGTGDPDRAKQLPEQTWELDPGTTAIKWELECVKRPGCLPTSINPAGNPAAPNPTRPIDPTGRPAVLSLYSLEVATTDG